MMLPAHWRYPETAPGRDLRLDYVRGASMAFVTMFHIGGLSLFHLFAMFGVEVVAGGEVFVLLSGMSLARAQRRRNESEGWSAATMHLLFRALQLYVLFVIVALIAWWLSHLPVPAADVLTTWREKPGAEPFSMYGDQRSFWGVLAGVMLLRYAPWQYGIVGLFVVLAALCPLGLRLLAARRWWLLLAISWVVYAIGVLGEIRILGGAFEGGAPLLTWQLVFVHGLIAGYHRAALVEFLYSRRGRRLVALSFGLAAVIIFHTLNAPWITTVLWSKLPSWVSLGVLAPETFQWVQDNIFGSRAWPLPGRIASILIATIVFGTVLAMFWKPLERLGGWLFIPLGEESLLVFTSQLFIIFAIAQTELIADDAIIRNTIVQTAAVLLLLAMAQTRRVLRRKREDGAPVTVAAGTYSDRAAQPGIPVSR
jgi:hypothetical protein